MVSSVLMFQPIKHKFHLIFISRPKGRRSTSSVSHPPRLRLHFKQTNEIPESDIGLLSRYLFGGVLCFLDSWWKSRYLGEVMLHESAGFSKGMHFLHRVYGLKLSYFNKKTPTDFTITISLIASLVMSLFITVRFG